MVLGTLDLDYNALWEQAKTAGTALVTKDLPAAVEQAVVQRAQAVATPIVQRKAQSAVSKGNVTLFAAGGVVLGALIAGGGWQRRAIGGAAVGGLSAFLSFKLGLAEG